MPPPTPPGWSIETLAVHAGGADEAGAPDVAPPIHLATTFRRDAALEPLSVHTYGRESNPSVDRLEAALASLEGGAAGVAFASGMAAATTLLQAIDPGGRVLLPDDVYYGVRAALAEMAPRWGHQFEIYDPADLGALEASLAADAAARPALLWLESPSNPLLRVVDLERAAALGRDAGATVVADNTFATPVLQRPLALGADVVLHSTTKYCGGHGDVLGGALVFGRAEGLQERVRHLRHHLGGMASPFAAWLTARGLRTLACRVAWQARSADAVARFLAADRRVRQVNYPGLEAHPGHAIARRQMQGGFGGMLSFHVAAGREAARAVVGAARLFTRATSLGGVESLIEHRRSSEGPSGRAPEDLVRLSIGLEGADDLIADLEQALRHAG